MAPNVPGAHEVVSWFGKWPTFHDAEVESIAIHRNATSAIRIHAWITTDTADASGAFARTRHAIVVLEFSGIRDLSLAGEDADVQNVIAGLLINSTENGFRVELLPSYGIAGELTVANLTLRVEPLREKAGDS